MLTTGMAERTSLTPPRCASNEPANSELILSVPWIRLHATRQVEYSGGDLRRVPAVRGEVVVRRLRRGLLCRMLRVRAPARYQGAVPQPVRRGGDAGRFASF